MMMVQILRDFHNPPILAGAVVRAVLIFINLNKSRRVRSYDREGQTFSLSIRFLSACHTPKLHLGTFLSGAQLQRSPSSCNSVCWAHLGTNVQSNVSSVLCTSGCHVSHTTELCKVYSHHTLYNTVLVYHADNVRPHHTLYKYTL